jgi:hypothetical protein
MDVDRPSKGILLRVKLGIIMPLYKTDVRLLALNSLSIRGRERADLVYMGIWWSLRQEHQPYVPRHANQYNLA